MLEDIIFAGIEYLSRSISSIPEKNDLDSKTDLFNTLGSDFQDSWNSQFWQIYEQIRGGYQKKDYKKPADKIAHLQELAIVMSKSSIDDKKEESKALVEIDELSKKFKSGHNEIISRKCCNCSVM